jgi:hypothetical protein
LNAWLWVLTIMGVGMTYLNSYRPFLFYANEAVLPFYILHQTVLLVIGYYVTRWQVPDIAKYILIACSGFAAIMLLYELCIRRVNALRFLFGMKPNPKIQISPAFVEGRASIKPN